MIIFLNCFPLFQHWLYLDIYTIIGHFAVVCLVSLLWYKPHCFSHLNYSTYCHLSFIVKLLWRKGDEDYFSSKLCVRIKNNKNSTHGKFHQFLFPFSSKFSDLNFVSYVLYIYLCYVTCHTQWAWNLPLGTVQPADWITTSWRCLEDL